MATSLHLIFKQQFHLRFMGGEIAVHTLSAALSRWQRDVLLPGMQVVLDELDVADRHLRLDVLQIDAEEIIGGDWEQQLANKICRELRKQIREGVPFFEEVVGMSDEKGVGKKDGGKSLYYKEGGEFVEGEGMGSAESLGASGSGMESAGTTATGRLAGTEGAGIDTTTNTHAGTYSGTGGSTDAIGATGTYSGTTGSTDAIGTTGTYSGITGSTDAIGTTGTYSGTTATNDNTVASQLSAFAQNDKDNLQDNISQFNEAEQLQLVLYYLQTGALPWYAAALPGKDILHWLNGLVTAGYLSSKEGIVFLNAHPVALQRLLVQVTPVLLQESFMQWNISVFQQYFSEISKVATNLFDTGNARVWAYAVLYNILADPAAYDRLADAGIAGTVPLWKQWLTSENVAYEAVMNIFAQYKGVVSDQIDIVSVDKQIVNEDQSSLSTEDNKQAVSDQLSSSQKNLTSPSDPTSPKNLTSQKDPVSEEDSASKSSETTGERALTEKGSAALQTETDHISSLFTQKDESSFIPKDKSSFFTPKDDPISSPSTPKDKPLLFSFNPNNKSPFTQKDEQISTPKDKSPNILKDEPHTAENGLFINNAGLVLLHPFISPWLTNLGLLEDDKWKDISAHRRAVQLLYYLSTGSLTSTDYELPLCKLLLGFELDEPAAAVLDITKEEETESTDLLQEVIKQWPILKDTSPESLQETFLQRDGRLIHHPGKWQLHVEQSPYDMLLQHMPWGFGVIRSSMMKELLFVDWA
jgi:hypothetical protein